MSGPALLAHAGPGAVPPELTPGRLLTEWVLEPLPALFILAAGGLYLVGVHRLRARGHTWSRARTACFVVLGLGSFAIATMSPLAAYDTVLLSVHMVQHMVLSMVTPVFLALGAPVTLALRTLPRGPRAWVLTVLHSGVAKVLSFPVVAGALFVATPFALYFTGWYEATLRSGVLHDFMHLHFLAVGSLWFWPLLGLDPTPLRLAYPLRMLAVFLTLPFHAWLGIAVMSQGSVIAADWYSGLGRDWGASPLSDQRTAGGILWASGDLVALVVLAVLFAQWVRASEREAAREDRRLDRLDVAAARTESGRR